MAVVTRRRWWQRISRDVVLFSLGIYFAVNELVVRPEDLPERPFTLAFIAACLGTPFVLRYDEARRARLSSREDES